MQGTTGLHRLAKTMGAILISHHDGIPGWYSLRDHTISLRKGMSRAQYRSILAHELGHAHHRDEPAGTYRDARQERRADQWAANLLIDRERLKHACIIHDGHIGAVADELEVTRHLISVYIGMKPAMT